MTQISSIARVCQRQLGFVVVLRDVTDAVRTMLCQENELCLWHVDDVAASGSVYDETEEMRIEDEPELLVKVTHRGDVTDLLVRCTYLHTYSLTTVLLSSCFTDGFTVTQCILTITPKLCMSSIQQCLLRRSMCVHKSVSVAQLVNATVHATGTGGQTTLRFSSGDVWFAY